MAYTDDRAVYLRVDQSPSLQYNNLTTSSRSIAFSHKDSVFTLTTRAVSGQILAKPVKVPLFDSGVVYQVAWINIHGRAFLGITTQKNFSVYKEEGGSKIYSRSLTACGIREEDAVSHFFRGINFSSTMDCILVGTSWGDIIVEKLLGAAESSESYHPKPSLLGHKAAVTFIQSDDKYIYSADDTGVIIQWDKQGDPLVKHNDAKGFPCTSLVLLKNIVIASYASGYLRIYGNGNNNRDDRALQAEIGAHARCITALHVHPVLPIFASVGEDCVVNVWSLPNVSSSNSSKEASTVSNDNKTTSSSSSAASSTSTASTNETTSSSFSASEYKLVLDMSSAVPHQILTGVQFVPHPDGVGNGVHIVAAAFDWTSMRVFYGLGSK